MKTSPVLRPLLLLLPLLGASSSSALPAPKYLSIERFEQCLATQRQASHQSWCMPAQKAAACPESSWQQLKNLAPQDQVPACQAPPGAAAASAASAASAPN